jgi:hypothetical protein
MMTAKETLPYSPVVSANPVCIICASSLHTQSSLPCCFVFMTSRCRPRLGQVVHSLGAVDWRGMWCTHLTTHLFSPVCLGCWE